MELVVADGGRVIPYAPHITEVAAMHPAVKQIGYHCRDYFLGRWERFRDVRRGDLAHATHLRGAWTWDAERCRVRVTLAKGIPEDVVRRIGLDQLDRSEVDLEAMWQDPGTPFVAEAGEVLYRLRG